MEMRRSIVRNGDDERNRAGPGGVCGIEWREDGSKRGSPEKKSSQKEKRCDDSGSASVRPPSTNKLAVCYRRVRELRM